MKVTVTKQGPTAVKRYGWTYVDQLGQTQVSAYLRASQAETATELAQTIRSGQPGTITNPEVFCIEFEPQTSGETK